MTASITDSVVTSDSSLAQSFSPRLCSDDVGLNSARSSNGKISGAMEVQWVVVSAVVAWATVISRNGLRKQKARCTESKRRRGIVRKEYGT